MDVHGVGGQRHSLLGHRPLLAYVGSQWQRSCLDLSSHRPRYRPVGLPRPEKSVSGGTGYVVCL